MLDLPLYFYPLHPFHPHSVPAHPKMLVLPLHKRGGNFSQPFLAEGGGAEVGVKAGNRQHHPGGVLLLVRHVVL